jgi:aryl-alcohol dehydrogenase-like predicted oxidoreductase
MTTRRGFLRVTAAAMMAGAASQGKEKPQAGGAPTGTVPKGRYKIPDGAQVPTRDLGRTGERVSIIGLGGYHLGIPPEAEAIRIVRRALDHGVRFLDNCWDYNNGDSERRMGKALADGWRKKAFLMTKLDGRTAQSAREQLDQSLERLRTDVIDLVQIHEIIRKEDPDVCFRKGGTIEALVAAKKAGKIRFIGFTGHKDPEIHALMLEVARANQFHFDTVQMPINVLDAHYRSFEHEVIPVAQRDGVAVLGMKSLGAGLVVESGAAKPEDCLRYAMSVPGISVTITGCDSEGVLEQALHLAIGFTPMPEAERKALLARTEPAAQNGKWERFKTTHEFDGTEQHKRWLTTSQI